ncbi:hypothetical protein BC351_00205 [Paenibacillus ferrarius]|uniref:Recombinase zinc beta ribbon domain-containing protein n=1 Tax=Paenibacillus ferrarius TaxID=1469647 RepID=A0A1V4HRY2_9BACL|nr:hypothetical protein [Paenibacillus ferrarius]OPH61699.1 hypothetical protein BC351_00205 [Paenibacillus ferrarius]
MLELNKGTVKCLSCGKNYRSKMERKKQVFVCGGFANYGKDFCTYNPLQADELILTISKHFAVLGRRIEGEIKDLVDRIEVTPEKGYTIYYKDGSSPSVIDESNDYGIKVKY